MIDEKLIIAKGVFKLMPARRTGADTVTVYDNDPNKVVNQRINSSICANKATRPVVSLTLAWQISSRHQKRTPTTLGALRSQW